MIDMWRCPLKIQQHALPKFLLLFVVLKYLKIHKFKIDIQWFYSPYVVPIESYFVVGLREMFCRDVLTGLLQKLEVALICWKLDFWNILFENFYCFIIRKWFSKDFFLFCWWLVKFSIFKVVFRYVLFYFINNGICIDIVIGICVLKTHVIMTSRCHSRETLYMFGNDWRLCSNYDHAYLV
jgi:hypothetical protein